MSKSRFLYGKVVEPTRQYHLVSPQTTLRDDGWMTSTEACEEFRAAVAMGFKPYLDIKTVEEERFPFEVAQTMVREDGLYWPEEREGPTDVDEKTLGNTDVNGTRKNVPDVVVYGDGDTFRLWCKASSQAQGWMKSTKVANVPGGALVQVSTQQRNPDGSYAVAEALTFAPGVWLDKTLDPPRMIPIREQED